MRKLPLCRARFAAHEVPAAVEEDLRELFERIDTTARALPIQKVGDADAPAVAARCYRHAAHA